MSSFAPEPTSPEEGDYIINWHLQYCASLLLQGEAWATTMSDQIKSELLKIKTDSEFIRQNFSGPHTHLQRLKATSSDLNKVLEKLREIDDIFRLLARRTGQRIII